MEWSKDLNVHMYVVQLNKINSIDSGVRNRARLLLETYTRWISRIYFETVIQLMFNYEPLLPIFCFVFNYTVMFKFRVYDLEAVKKEFAKLLFFICIFKKINSC